MSDDNLIERIKKSKIDFCLSVKEGFEVVFDKERGCGFYQQMPCRFQGELLHNKLGVPLYECKRKELYNK